MKFLILCILLMSIQVLAQCGSERVLVKTLRDADVNLIDWTKVTYSDVSEAVRSTSPPGVRLRSSDNKRIAWEEKQLWSIDGWIVGFKLEKDQDIHVVIRSFKGNATMIVELPYSDCMSRDQKLAPIVDLIVGTRETFIAKYGKPTARFKRLAHPEHVTITGVGFYDFLHHQTGAARNGFEIHPVISIGSGFEFVTGSR